MSASHYTTYNGFHALVCGMSCPVLLCTRPIGFCRAGSYRGAGVGCEAPHLRFILRILRMDSIPSCLSTNLHIYRPSEWASVMVYLLSRCGVMNIAVVPFIAGKVLSPARTNGSPPHLPEGISGGQQATNKSREMHNIQATLV